MSDKKDKKIVNGEYSLLPRNADPFPSEFLYDTDKFVDVWAAMVREKFTPKGQDISKPVPGVVLKVIKNGKLSPGGPRSRINQVSSLPQSTCLKVWVHTTLDSGLSVPDNFMNPGDQESLIYEHYVYEASPGYEGQIPSPGDFVNVVHPWAFGFTNKVGLYQGIISQGIPPALKKASSNFKNKKNSRSKIVT
jgi:hypothetical protein